jgi:hypothetical protein
MNRLGKYAARLTMAVIPALAFCVNDSPAAEVLSNGGFEQGAGPFGWTLEQSIVGLPGVTIGASEQVDSGEQGFPETPGLGLLVKPFAGNRGDYAGQNKAVNLTMSQTFTFGASAAGRTYTFDGFSFYQLQSSNNLNTLGVLTTLGDYNLDASVNAADYTIWRDTLGSTTDFRANGTNEGASLDLIDQADYDYWAERFGNAGHGEIPSPTQTKYQIEFLNNSNVVLDTASVDLPRNRPTDVRPDDWLQSSVSKVAPAGTTKIRASVIATDMVDSCSVCTAGQDVFFDNFRLRDSVLPTNRLVNGDLNAPGAPVDFTIVKTAQDNIQFTNASYAVHTGNQGLWFRTFNGGDARVEQVLAGNAGTEYSFSTWAKIQPGYSGLDPLAATDTFVRMEFLDGSGVVIPGPNGTKTFDPTTLSWPAGMDNQGEWQQIPAVVGIAPAGTASVRVAIGATAMVNSEVGLPQGLMFDDLSLTTNMGAGSLAAVPEPGSLVLLLIAFGVFGVGRRMR